MVSSVARLERDRAMAAVMPMEGKVVAGDVEVKQALRTEDADIELESAGSSWGKCGAWSSM